MGESRHDLGGSTVRSSPSSRTGEATGDYVGPYKLLGIIGEGGFGTVWLAERREPITQRVALKIIKPGMDSRAVIARFEQERQALAAMDHPNVAKVFDAGTTASGRPYFVMELIKGEPITAFCDRHRLTIRQRLELFIPVCDAVQHAHMKGIIHRDIKPTNILVGMVDTATEHGHARKRGAADPPPAMHGTLVKVIDFGVAKAISHTLTDKTIFTEQGMIIGTPEYMSPEQAEMGAVDIDTRTDVYALGVVLYELLAGVLPFEPAELRSKGYNEIQRIIREVEAPRPSTRVMTGDAAATRTLSQAELAQVLARELEWVPLVAIRKNRAERYATPLELASDIRRYLQGEPLQAGPQSLRYRLMKGLAKHKVAAAAVTTVIVLLSAGLTSTLLLSRSLREQRDRAADAERESGAQARRASLSAAELHLSTIDHKSDFFVPAHTNEEIDLTITRALELIRQYGLVTDPDCRRLTCTAMVLWTVALRETRNANMLEPPILNESVKGVERLTTESPDLLVMIHGVDVPVRSVLGLWHLGKSHIAGMSPRRKQEQLDHLKLAAKYGLDESLREQVERRAVLAFMRELPKGDRELKLLVAQELSTSDLEGAADLALAALAARQEWSSSEFRLVRNILRWQARPLTTPRGPRQLRLAGEFTRMLRTSSCETSSPDWWLVSAGAHGDADLSTFSEALDGAAHCIATVWNRDELQRHWNSGGDSYDFVLGAAAVEAVRLQSMAREGGVTVPQDRWQRLALALADAAALLVDREQDPAIREARRVLGGRWNDSVDFNDSKVLQSEMIIDAIVTVSESALRLDPELATRCHALSASGLLLAPESQREVLRVKIKEKLDWVADASKRRVGHDPE